MSEANGQNVIKRLRDVLRWPRPQWRTVATAVFTTDLVRDDGSETGVSYRHVVGFEIDRTSGGKRTKVLDTSAPEKYRNHCGIVQARAEWAVHGLLPPYAIRVNPPELRVVAFKGKRKGKSQ